MKSKLSLNDLCVSCGLSLRNAGLLNEIVGNGRFGWVLLNNWQFWELHPFQPSFDGSLIVDIGSVSWVKWFILRKFGLKYSDDVSNLDKELGLGLAINAVKPIASSFLSFWLSIKQNIKIWTFKIRTESSTQKAQPFFMW